MHPKYLTWITLHTKDLYPYCIPGQLDALQAFITHQGYDDPMPDVLLDAIGYVRSIVFARHPSSALQYPFRIPAQLKTHTCHIAVDLLSTRLPGLHPSEDQLRNVKESRQYLKDLAQNKAQLLPDAPLPPGTLARLTHSARPKACTHKTLRPF